jgi:hypothetical protein
MFRLISIYFAAELSADQELPVAFSRDPFAFLEKATKETRDEYIRLYKDRKTPRNELQKKRDELIAKESEEIQVCFPIYQNLIKFKLSEPLRRSKEI